MPTINYYDPDVVWKILQKEEKCGNLKEDDYSEKVRQISSRLKQLRDDKRALIKKKDRSRIEELNEEIEVLRRELDSEKRNEAHAIANAIAKGNETPRIKQICVNNGKERHVFVADNVKTRIVCQIIKQELKRRYKLIPSDLNPIVEQLKALLNNGLPKTVIRADIKDFFDSIPCDCLIKTLNEDGYMTKISLRYLKETMGRCKEMPDGRLEKGVPQGLAFSSYLAEMYMLPIDEEISRMEGVYYYKRYVDDIVIVATTSVSKEDYWTQLEEIFSKRNLQLHAQSDKRYCEVWDESTAKEGFDYLGYSFHYAHGKLEVGMSKKRYNKYRLLIDALFDIYAKCANCRSRKSVKGRQAEGKKDALSELFIRLKMLTSNGKLSGRKNFVATGIYYSNKHMTTDMQLRELDAYLKEAIERKFNPPTTLFNFGEGNGYAENLQGIKDKLARNSFVRGFWERTLHVGTNNQAVLLDLQRIYHSRHD